MFGNHRGFFKKLMGALAVAASMTALVVPASAQADEADGVWETVRSFVEREMEARDVPGVAASLVSSEGVLESEGFGLADMDSGDEVDAATTRFSLGSEAKLFTAQAVLQLVEAGRVDLDADVNEYLKGFSIEDTYPGRPVTVQNLLTHTGGFDDDHFIGSAVESGPIPPLAEAVEDTQPERIRPPGESVSYDNYGFMLAAYIVECVTGVPYEQYVRENVFEPLGMADSSVKVPYDEETESNIATGYIRGREGLRPTGARYGVQAPAGMGPVASGDDMAVYLAAMMARDERLGEGVAEQMLTRQAASAPGLRGMGFGWEQRSVEGHDVWYKSGDVPGSHTGMAIIPELDLGFHIASNAESEEGGGIGPSDLLEEIVTEHLPALEPPTLEAVEGTDSSQYEGYYLNSRTSENGFTRIRAFLDGPVHVESLSDGRIVTEGLFGETVEWTPLGDGRYGQEGTFRELVFTDGDSFALDGGLAVHDKVSWLHHPALYRVLVVAALIAAAGVFVGATVALVRGKLSLEWAVAGVNALLALGFAIIMAVVLAEGKFAFLVALVTADPVLITALALASLTVPVTVVQVVLAVRGLVRKRGPLAGRMFYIAATLGALSFTAFCLEYNIVGPPFT
ncbi:serine hydrolase domain-containing protein [Haloglycomyces albus]|uniref:serine hydrolase domain-containing protein n=1 Tax=Haloglycomyces albus TaxID=526067 RepID=UPI00046D656C|nr:serine hydrolase domain-containing protein [Haloglycomyces albus]